MLLVTVALSALLAADQPLSVQTPQATSQTPPAAVQTPPEDEPLPTISEDEIPDDAAELEAVLVTAPRARGSVDSDIPPDVTLTAEDIQTYGAGTIEELLTYLEPLTRSTRGRGDGQPVTLVNGRRITGFREIAGLPPEAIDRVDILPEEVALRYGYRADQRVVNFVLKSDFRSVSGQVRGTQLTEGGRSQTELSGNGLSISGARRLSLDVNIQRSTPLFETERDIDRDGGSTPFDRIGNVTGAPFSAEIDPAFSALVGEQATRAPVPGNTANPTLAQFAAAYGAPREGDLTTSRTLLAESEQATIRGTYKTDLNGSIQATVNASLQDQSSESFNGLPGITLTLPTGNPFSPFTRNVQLFRYLDVPDALSRQTDTLTGNLGVVLDGYLGEDWRWTFNGAYDRVETDTVTGRGYAVTPFQTRLNANDPTANPFALTLDPAQFTALPFDTANSVSQVLSAEVVLTGDLYELPAGDISSNFTFGADTRSLDSTSTRGGLTTDREQSRDRFNAQSSFDIPLLERIDGDPWRGGDLSMNFNAGYEELSDFGGLNTLGLGFNWQPITPVSLVVSYTDEEGAPTISQLNDPVITTPASPVFDFRTNQTVLVTRIDGGNPNLNADNRRVVRAGITLRPFEERNLSIQSTWTRSVTDNPINAFPAITPDLEAALPGRFTRDVNGNLTAFDARPLNFDSAERQDLRTGFNFSTPFGTPRPRAAGQGQGQGPQGGAPMVIMGGPPPGAGGGDGPRIGGQGGPGGPGGGGFRMQGGPGGPGGGGGRGGGIQPGQGRFNISLFHTYRIQDEIVISPGLQPIDLLNGGATSARGGSPRNEIQLQAGVFKDGFGGFMNANWRDATVVDGGTGPDLRFAGQTTVNLNLFMDFNQRASLIEKFPILKGARLNLGIQNLFDSEPEVTSTAGDVPLNYQPDFLDPQGRTVSLTFRKILF